MTTLDPSFYRGYKDSTLLWHLRRNYVSLFHKYRTRINTKLLWHLRRNLTLLSLSLSQISDLYQQQTFLTFETQSYFMSFSFTNIRLVSTAHFYDIWHVILLYYIFLFHKYQTCINSTLFWHLRRDFLISSCKTSTCLNKRSKRKFFEKLTQLRLCFWQSSVCTRMILSELIWIKKYMIHARQPQRCKSRTRPATDQLM